MKARNRVDGFRVKESRTRLGPEFVLVRILVVLVGMAPGLALIQRAPRPSERYVIYVNPYSGFEITHPASWYVRRLGDGMSATVSQRLTDSIHFPHKAERTPVGSQIRLEVLAHPEGEILDITSFARDRLGFVTLAAVTDRRKGLDKDTDNRAVRSSSYRLGLCGHLDRKRLRHCTFSFRSYPG